MKRILPFIVAILFVFSTGQLLSQDKTSTAAPVSDADAQAALAKAAANPIANMISLPFQFNFNLAQGPYDRFGIVMNFEPVLPFRLSKKWNVVIRTIIPIVMQPNLYSETTTYSGLATTNFNAYFVPPMVGDWFTYGFGVTMMIPTATSFELGGDAFGIGPNIVFLFMPGSWVMGATIGQAWAYKTQDASELSGTDALNTFFAQYFITWNLKKSWFINTSPTMSANWNAPEGKQWTVPVGIGFGKVFHFPHIPTKFMLQYYYNVVTPQSSTDGTVYIDTQHNPVQATSDAPQSIVFQVTLMFPSKKK